jgi:hypothetical protein
MTRRILPCTSRIALIAARKKAFQRHLNSRQYSPPGIPTTTDTTTLTGIVTTDTNIVTPVAAIPVEVGVGEVAVV